MSIVIVLIILVNLTPVQNFLAQKVVHYLSEKLNTKVSLRQVRISLFNAATIEGLYIEDKQGDTLLYAGEAGIRISDWFFLKNKPVISYIGLKNAYAHLYRKRNSDQWNYQFVIDAFTSQEKKSKSKSSASLNLDLRDIVLQNVRFDMIDEWVGSDMIGTLEEFTLDAKKIDFDKKNILVNSINGSKVVFGLRDYKGGKPYSRKSNNTTVIDTTPFNPGLWTVSLKELTLKDSRFFLEDPDSKAPEGFFDDSHMDITGILLDVRDVQIMGDTLKAELRMLQGRERCGLEIKKMSAQVTVSPNISECKKLVLQTQYSNLTDYYAMKYQRFPDFLDYITNVVMVANLHNSEVGMQDIIYFAPALQRFKNISVKISGKGKGTVEKLNVTDLTLYDGFSKLKGNLYMNGLPDIDNTFIDFQKGEVNTNGAAAFLYAPGLRNEKNIDLASLRQVDFKGSFTGYISDFVAYGAFSSNLGNVKADINLKLPAKGRPSYSGTLATDNFDIGQLLRQDFMSKVTASAKVKGIGFDAASAALNIDGRLQAFNINGYTYKDIKIDGVLASRKFDGNMTSKDPNLLMDFNGKIDFSGIEPLFDVTAQIEHLNTQALNYTKDTIIANGDMKLNFSGDSIDDFIGSAYLYHINIMRNGYRLNIDSLQLVSQVNEQQEKQLSFSTNELSASIYGAFSLIDLPNSAQLFLSYYLPEYVKRPSRVNENQNLNFEIKANNTDDIMSLFSKSLRIGPLFNLTGSMNMGKQQLEFKGSIPYILYGNIRVSDIRINSKGDYSGLSLEAMANGITAGGTDIASSVQFQSHIFQDTAKFQLLTTTPTSIGSAELNGAAYAHNDSFTLNILPSEFYLNESRWEIANNNRIVFSKNHIVVDNLHLLSGLQSITVNDKGHRESPDNAMVVIKNFDIAPLNTLLGLEELNLDGRINGNVHLSSLLRNQVLDFDIAANNLKINNDTLGDARAVGSYDVSKSLVALNKESGLSYQDSKASLYGVFSLDPESKENIDAHIEMIKANVNWAQPFLTGYVHNLSGHVNGSISLKGNAANPLTIGTVELNNIGFVPDITGVHYTIKEAKINVSDTKFDLGAIKVADDNGREGIVGGSIIHERLSKMSFRVNMRSDNIQVLDLKDYQNANFYGDVKASVQLRLSGPANNLNLNIFATPQKNSHLYVPIGYGSDVGEYDYIHFKQYGEVQTAKEVNKNKLNIRLDAIVTPDLEATIIIDPATGDQIWAKGSGNIILEIPADGEMKMNGNYIIDEGKYNFSFKQLQVLNYKRQFTINSNSAIKWNGDIADADLDVTAYAQIKARLYDLIINEVDRIGLSPQEIRDAQIMQMINVGLNMRGSLKEPELSFKLDLVENRSVGTYAYQKLQRINTDDKELLNQVASLLLLEQFVPPEGLSNSNAVTSGTINNMSELVSSAASSQITNFANKILGMEDLYVGVRYKNYSLSNTDQFNTINYINRNEAGINLRKSFLKNRLVVEVGGVYDWGRNSSQSDLTTNFVGDFRVQYLISEDGRVRFNVFRASNYDAIGGQTIGRQGVGLSYRKSFNGLLDLFRNEEKIRREREAKMKQQRQQSFKVDPLPDTSRNHISYLKNVIQLKREAIVPNFSR